MTVSDIKDQLPLFSDYELEKIIDEINWEVNKRASARREELKKAFFKAWRDLEEDGATIFLKESQMLEAISLEDLEIE